ncbi:DUF1471 domain-containing protein [Pantoea agglomerans]|uniref:DUF1471 domain-containing protein n=1 Tax=Enterobacter agglomerans TaxID=549 RepID=UPI0010BFAC93|nr:DUF1471 domain-containing protein [Pantoea agglomerans]MBD8144768.1 DUF1471 domain-containing protein [Pantoea agglomerans]MBD8183382.1 DUF1471 domain-containing protein [Pantoea agglomerans]MBD8222469.1 DUF1471 domain-containing protein [Pantoea agglomerans]TKJ56490.1 hypothetical protein PagCFBP13505_12415 [Pantoea agglomerans]TKK19461.1 hypothetical protein PagCFBP13516_11485 [Pantoea agglomerans]
MKKTILLLSLLTLTGSSFAATLVQRSELGDYTIKDRISISGVRGGKSHAVNALSNEADKRSAGYFFITSLSTGGDSSHWRGTAVTLEKNEASK